MPRCSVINLLNKDHLHDPTFGGTSRDEDEYLSRRTTNASRAHADELNVRTLNAPRGA